MNVKKEKTVRSREPNFISITPTVYIEREKYKEMKLRAVRLDKRIADVLREAIELWLEKNKL